MLLVRGARLHKRATEPLLTCARGPYRLCVSRIQEMATDPRTLVFVLIDEVESIAGARDLALSRSEPSDAVRVVNALLTKLDALRQLPNVLVLATSNVSRAVDVAFIDRADIKLVGWQALSGYCPP